MSGAAPTKRRVEDEEDEDDDDDEEDEDFRGEDSSEGEEDDDDSDAGKGSTAAAAGPTRNESSEAFGARVVPRAAYTVCALRPTAAGELVAADDSEAADLAKDAVEAYGLGVLGGAREPGEGAVREGVFGACFCSRRNCSVDYQTLHLVRF
jgi:hypothetical protein